MSTEPRSPSPAAIRRWFRSRMPRVRRERPPAVFNGVTTTANQTVYVQGIATGTATLTFTSLGYQSATVMVTVDPGGFVISTSAITAKAGGANVPVSVQPAILTAGTLDFVGLRTALTRTRNAGDSDQRPDCGLRQLPAQWRRIDGHHAHPQLQQQRYGQRRGLAADGDVCAARRGLFNEPDPGWALPRRLLVPGAAVRGGSYGQPVGRACLGPETGGRVRERSFGELSRLSCPLPRARLKVAPAIGGGGSGASVPCGPGGRGAPRSRRGRWWFGRRGGWERASGRPPGVRARPMAGGFAHTEEVLHARLDPRGFAGFVVDFGCGGQWVKRWLWGRDRPAGGS